MVTEFQKARVVQLRGLGFQQHEIAEHRGLSKAQVAYYLGEFKKQCKEKDPDSVCLDIMLSGIGPLAIDFIKKLEELKKLV
ncbi:MAG: hypothetical protein U9Q22_06395 [Candidatus Altiarchaeota archaeon]|nr:hypothetical protein [Candidatus Altiarchaeota archaeon]